MTNAESDEKRRMPRHAAVRLPPSITRHSAVTGMASFGPQSIYLTIAQQADREDGGTVLSQSRRLAAILPASMLYRFLAKRA
jgi:hypothetical protein